MQSGMVQSGRSDFAWQEQMEPTRKMSIIEYCKRGNSLKKLE